MSLPCITNGLSAKSGKKEASPMKQFCAGQHCVLQWTGIKLQRTIKHKDAICKEVTNSVLSVIDNTELGKKNWKTVIHTHLYEQMKSIFFVWPSWWEVHTGHQFQSSMQWKCRFLFPFAWPFVLIGVLAHSDDLRGRNRKGISMNQNLPISITYVIPTPCAEKQ